MVKIKYVAFEVDTNDYRFPSCVVLSIEKKVVVARKKICTVGIFQKFHLQIYIKSGSF